MQQYLPFTVLKQTARDLKSLGIKLQQYLPFTVLKLINNNLNQEGDISIVATVLTVYGIETKAQPSK